MHEPAGQERLPPLTAAWLILVTMTLLAWSIGVFGHATAHEARLAMAGVIATGCVKVWLIAWQFMELKIAPRLLRIGFTAWLVAVGTVLTVICVAGGGAVALGAP